MPTTTGALINTRTPAIGRTPADQGSKQSSKCRDALNSIAKKKQEVFYKVGHTICFLPCSTMQHKKVLN
jgi:hypothetical protein